MTSYVKTITLDKFSAPYMDKEWNSKPLLGALIGMMNSMHVTQQHLRLSGKFNAFTADGRDYAAGLLILPRDTGIVGSTLAFKVWRATNERGLRQYVLERYQP